MPPFHPQVRHACLSVMSKVLYVSSSEMLQEGLRGLAVCSFIGSLMSGRDNAAMAYALQMAEILMEKLPGIYRVQFLKEGVLHAINRLAGTAPVPASAAGTSAGDVQASSSDAPDPKSTSPGSGQKGSKGV